MHNQEAAKRASMPSMPASVDESHPSTLERILRQVHAALNCRRCSIESWLVSKKATSSFSLFSRLQPLIDSSLNDISLESVKQGGASADASWTRCPRVRSAAAGACCS